MITPTSALSVLLAGFAASSRALPTTRDAPPAVDATTVEALWTSAMQDFIAEVHGDFSRVSLLTGGLESIDYAGNHSASTDYDKNNVVYKQLDNVYTNGSQVFFSDQYKHFIEDMNKAMNLPNATDHPDVAAAMKAQTSACGHDGFSTVIKDALVEYHEEHPKNTDVDPDDQDFMEWAEDNYTPYNNAKSMCLAATSHYEAVYTQDMGDDFAVFSAAVENMRPITDPDTAPHPGIMMEVRNSTGTDASGHADAGNLVPAYSVPLLNTTLSAWQQGLEMQKFIHNYTQTTGSVTNDTKGGSGGFSFAWSSGGASAGGSGGSADFDVKTTATWMGVSFGSIAVMNIDIGLWFDSFRIASLVKDPADNMTAAAVPVFNKYFGTKENPGPAAVYNSKVLVAYQPKIDIAVGSNDVDEAQKTVAANAKICFLAFCGGGGGGSSADDTHWVTTNDGLSYNDDSGNGYIIGFVQQNFWETA